MKELCPRSESNTSERSTGSSWSFIATTLLPTNPPQPDVVARRLEALGRNDRLVYECLQGSGSVSSAEVSTELSVPVRTVRDALRRLTENELVTPSGNRKSRTYRIAEA